MELSDVFDCKKGIMKQMKIVKMAGEFSPTTILHICRHLVKKINILHFCKPSYVKLVIFGGKFACFNEERKVLQDFLRNEISVTCLTYLRVKNDLKNKNSCHIHFTLFGTKFL